ncbi:nuclease-related domain-containing protein, partial [Jatrophihabitans sp.]|uniref:nuclease-related domain-containing protein n=1 Tax=Jatrophihabitans sp. TaxID=1932789 RepID=UPI002F113A18
MTHDVLIVTRWVRYGHDRLYVKAADGTELGYRDNKSGVNHVVAGADGEAFQAALAAYWAGGGKPAPETAMAPAVPRMPRPVPGTLPPVVPVAPETLLPPEKPWTDLSLARPGAAARDRALAKRGEAPVKSLFARVLGVHTEERAWRIGADGEELVAAQLQRLGPAWKTLHAVPVGDHGSDIDHVIVGPGGVYTINTKNHPDASVWAGGNTVMVNGAKTMYVRNSRFEARRAADLLTARAG